MNYWHINFIIGRWTGANGFRVFRSNGMHSAALARLNDKRDNNLFYETVWRSVRCQFIICIESILLFSIQLFMPINFNTIIHNRRVKKWQSTQNTQSQDRGNMKKTRSHNHHNRTARLWWQNTLATSLFTSLLWSIPNGSVIKSMMQKRINIFSPARPVLSRLQSARFTRAAGFSYTSDRSASVAS